MSFSGWEYGDDEFDDDTYDERIFLASLPERRRTELIKLISVYKAIHVGADIKTQLESLIASSAADLDDHAFQKKLRFNKPKSSLLDFFKTNNKVHPQQDKAHLKSLPIEQIAEFTAAKEILADILVYIQEQKTLDLIVKAVANVTRGEFKPICYVRGTTMDEEISLYSAIRLLEKGKLYEKYARGETKTLGPIKDKTILSILLETATALLNCERLLKKAMDKIGLQAESVFQTLVTNKYDEINPGHPSVPIIAKLDYLLANLKLEKYEKLKDDLKADLTKTAIPAPNTTPTSQPRRNAWK